MATVRTALGALHVDDQGTDDEPVALLWPSLFNDHTMWRYQVQALRSAGWRTLALDPPGHGLSTGLDRDFTMDQCADAAVQVLDAVGALAPVVVLGTSWGGIVAPRLALRAPDRVRGIVLFNTTAESAAPLDRARDTLLTRMLAIRALDGVVDRIVVSVNFTSETRRTRPELGAELVARYRSWNRRGLIHTVRSVLVDRNSILDALPYLKAPALVVSGKEDTLLPTILSRRMAERMPKARRVEVAGAAHLTPLEQHEEANRLVLEFIGSLPRL